MKQFLWVMQDELGLHARVAGDLVKCVNSCTSKVTLEKGGKQADASRLFAVMALCVKQGEEITVSVEGPQEEQDSAMLQEFFRDNM